MGKEMEIMEKALAHIEKGQYYAQLAEAWAQCNNVSAGLVGHWAGKCFAEREKADELMRGL